MDIQKVGVIGAGQMGNGIAHVLALAEHGLAALDRDPHLANGLNVRGGEVIYDAVLEAMQGAAA